MITGEFYIRYDDLPRNGPEPDGDTINFLPDSDGLVQSLPRFSGRPPDRRHLGTTGYVSRASTRWRPTETSVNAALVRAGLAYGELYATMPLDLILRMRQLVTSARQNGSGFWPQEDVTIDARVQVKGLPDLSELIMFPKLYRRLVTYFRAGNVGLASFDTWIRADPVSRDDTALLPTGELGNLHDLYDVDSGGITLRLLPEDLTFQPDPIVR